MTWYIGGMVIVERNYALIVNMFLWTSLAFIILVLRLYTRAILIRRVGADDYLMVAAFVSSPDFPYIESSTRSGSTVLDQIVKMSMRVSDSTWPQKGCDRHWRRDP